MPKRVKTEPPDDEVKPTPSNSSQLKRKRNSDDQTKPADPLSIDYSQHPEMYRILRGEMNVFKTNPYSAELKGLWRFKNAEVAQKSAEELYERFERYRDKVDFVGMDITRKFIQMGRTRSLRYALRPGGRKYSPTTGEEMERTGLVEDQGKLDGAMIFERYLKMIEDDEAYVKEKERWKTEVEGNKASSSLKTKTTRLKVEATSEDATVDKEPPAKRRKAKVKLED